MKKLLRLVPVLLLMMCAGTAGAQLSGIYTIGGTSPSYANFLTAVNALQTQGVSGPVTFNFRNGFYSWAADTITAITGASAANTITFQSESGVNTDVTLATGITLSAASFISINNLTMTVNGMVINLLGKSNNITISNNILNGSTVAGFGEDVITAIGFTGANLVICSNVINNGSEGICLYGTDNTPANIIVNAVIKNNLIQGFYGWGITANNQRGTLIEGNTITTAPSTGYGSIPLYIQNIMYPITVIKNKISITGPNAGIAGMYIVNNHPDSLSEGSVIANNSISIYNGTGMELINNDYFSFYYNSVYVISVGTSFILDGNSTGNVLADNIFYDASGQPAIVVDPSTALGSSDYNDIYATGANLGTWDGNNTATLAVWKTSSGMDTHSQSIAPAFVSDTNLDLSNFTPMQFGTPVGGVPDAINGDTRSTPPAVGAYDDGPPYAADSSTCCSCMTQTSSPPTAAFTGSPTSVCSGDTVAYTAQPGSGATSWKWTLTGGTPDTSSAQDPKVVYHTPGSYTVKLIVSGTGGTDSLIKTAYITVNTAPLAGTITGPGPVCAGDTVAITDTGSTGPLQWQWSNDGISFTTINGDTSTSNAIVANSPGTYYRVFSNNSCGADTSAGFQLAVKPLAVTGTITGPGAVCAGGTAALADSGSTGSLQWQASANGISFASMPGDTLAVDTPSSVNTSSYYRILASNGCGTLPSAAYQLVVNPLPVPVVSAPDSFMCQGNSTQVCTGDTFTTYLWNNNASTFCTTAPEPGEYWVTVTNTFGCSAVSGQQLISLYSIPSVAIDVVGDTLYSFGQVSYQWMLNGAAIDSATGTYYIATQAGSYTVQVTDSNGCTTISNPVVISGISDLSASGWYVNVFPNPSSVGSWQLTVGPEYPGLVGSALEIFDDQGRLVMKDEIRSLPTGQAGTNYELTAATLAAGVYYLRISNAAGSIVKKLVKM